MDTFLTPDVRSAFSELAAEIGSVRLTFADVIEAALGFLEGEDIVGPQGAQVGYALFAHARDYLLESRRSGSEPGDAAAVLIEAYRRTFCDAQYAQLYGTDNLVNQTDSMAQLLRFLAQGLRNHGRDAAFLSMPVDATARH